MLKSHSSFLFSRWLCTLTLLMLLLTLAALGQQASIVPTLVNFKGALTDVNGKPLTGTVGVTFYLYHDSEGGAPLWMETQNVQADKSGRYAVSLGATTSAGLPTDVFVSGEARWLGVQPYGQAEQPRLLLLSVPYALKAGDAETIGGLPASAFVLANRAQGSGPSAKTAIPGASSAADKNTIQPEVNPALTGKGVINYIPMWDSASDIVDSVIFQETSEIGIATTTPAATLDVNGKADVRDTLTLFPKSTDNTLAVSGTSFNISSTGKVTFITGQTFPGTGTITGITTASGSGLSGGGTTGTLSLKVPAAGITNAMLQKSAVTLNPNSAGGVTTPGAMTLGNTYTLGLKACTANQILKYSGTAWACSSVADGTITGITTASGSGLSGGGTTGTLNLKVPALGITNAMLANSKITLNANTAGGVTAPGAMTLGSTYTLGLKPCTANQILQYSGTAWNCATAGIGTITGVTAGTNLTGGGTSGSVTLNVDTSKVPQLKAANTFTGNQTVNGRVTAAAFSGDGTAVTNVDASSLGGISASGFATTGSANYFTASQVIEAALDVYPSSPGDAVDTQAFGGGAGLSAISDTGNGVAGISGTGYGVYGRINGGTNSGVGVYGEQDQGGDGVIGISGSGYGVYGDINGGTAFGVGVYGEQDNGGVGVVGYSSTGYGDAVQALGSGGHGLYASTNDGVAAVYGIDVAASGGVGVYGSSSGYTGVYGTSDSGDGVQGYSSTGSGIWGFSISGYAGDFFGNVEISGTLNGETPFVKMDHPLDPANKYLVHASVASSEMMNIYTGNITTDAQGEGTVQLPDWFEALNTDFRYQLTVIGQFAQAIVAREIENHRFQIRTNLPNVKVSWQVTGVRQDPYAKAHPLAAEQEKEAQLRGFYIHPELYGAPQQKQIEWGRNPELMKRNEEMMKHTNERRVPPPRPALRSVVSPRKNPLAFGSTPVHAPTPPSTVGPTKPR
jgi:hypothetical protein